MEKVKNLQVYKGVLIVVDMINAFVKEGELHDTSIGSIVPRQIELIKECHDKGYLVIFIKDTHNINATEFKRFENKKHSVKGTSEAEVIDELRPFEDMEDTISIEKNSTSYMEAPDFRKTIRLLTNVEKWHVVGCCTDICVMNGTMGLSNYLDEHNIDAEIFVHEDAIATFNQENRNEYVEASYLLMQQQGIQLVKKYRV